MAYQSPPQQQRYADSGRRTIKLLGQSMNASLAKLKEADAIMLGAEYEIFIDKLPRMVPQQIISQIIDFDGTPYRVVKVMDPKASDPVMKGRYLRLLSVKA